MQRISILPCGLSHHSQSCLTNLPCPTRAESLVAWIPYQAHLWPGYLAELLVFATYFGFAGALIRGFGSAVLPSHFPSTPAIPYLPVLIDEIPSVLFAAILFFSCPSSTPTSARSPSRSPSPSHFPFLRLRVIFTLSRGIPPHFVSQAAMHNILLHLPGQVRTPSSRTSGDPARIPARRSAARKDPVLPGFLHRSNPHVRK